MQQLEADVAALTAAHLIMSAQLQHVETGAQFCDGIVVLAHILLTCS